MQYFSLLSRGIFGNSFSVIVALLRSAEFECGSNSSNQLVADELPRRVRELRRVCGQKL
jgi:hypothetical protein